MRPIANQETEYDGQQHDRYQSQKKTGNRMSLMSRIKRSKAAPRMQKPSACKPSRFGSDQKDSSPVENE